MTTVTKIEHISSSDIDNECPYCKFDDAHKKPCNDCGEIHTPSPESFGKWLQRYFANSGTKEHENEVKMYTAHSRGGEHKDQIHNLRNSLESGKPKKLRSWGKGRPKKALKAECSGVGCKAEGKIPLTVSLDTGDVGKVKVCPECHKKILEHDAIRRHMEVNDPHRLSESQRDEMKAVMAVSAPEEGKTCNCNHGDHSNANGDLHSMYNQEGGRANWQGQGLPQPKHSNCQCDEQPVEHDKVPNADARLGEPKKDKKKKNDDYNPNREVVGAKDEDDFKRRQQGLGGKGGCRGVGCDKEAKHKIIALVRDHLTGSEVTNPNLSTRSHKEIINLCPDCYKKAKEWQKKRKNKHEIIKKKKKKRGGRSGSWSWFDKLQRDAKSKLKPKDTDDMTDSEKLDLAHYTGGEIISNTPKPKPKRFGNLSDEVLEGLNINPKTGKSKKGGKKKKKKIVQPKPVLTDDDPYKEAALIKALNILKRSPPRDAGYTARKKLADEMKRADENMKINEEKKKKKKKVKPKPKKSKFDFFNRTEGNAEANPEMSAQEWLDDYKKKKKKRQLRYQTSKGDDNSNLPKPQTSPAKIENQDCPYCNTKRALERAGKKTDVRSFAELFNSINAKQAEEQRGGGLSLVNILNNYKLHEGGKEKLFHQAPSKKKKKVRIIKGKKRGGMLNYNYLFDKPDIEEGVTHGKKKKKKKQLVEKKRKVRGSHKDIDKLMAGMSDEVKENYLRNLESINNPSKDQTPHQTHRGTDWRPNKPTKPRGGHSGLTNRLAEDDFISAQIERIGRDEKELNKNPEWYLENINQRKKSWVEYFLKGGGYDKNTIENDKRLHAYWTKRHKEHGMKMSKNFNIRTGTIKLGRHKPASFDALVESNNRSRGLIDYIRQHPHKRGETINYPPEGYKGLPTHQQGEFSEDTKEELKAEEQVYNVMVDGVHIIPLPKKHKKKKIKRRKLHYENVPSGDRPFDNKAEENQFGAWGQRGLGDGSGTGAIQGSGDTHLISPVKQKELDKLMAGARYLPRSVARKKP